MKFEFPFINPPKREFSPIALSDWSSWSWQMRNALKSRDDFEREFPLSKEESFAFHEGEGLFNIRVTPYYAALVRSEEASDPIRKIFMPHALELGTPKQAMLDPLGENKNRVTSRLIHRYPDRVLFLVTDVCSVYCRFCTRKHFTGQEQAFLKKQEYVEALDYIRAHKGLREVILSGGDPLTLSDSQLDMVLSDLRSIEHVEIIRIGTRMPVVCPMRVTTDLVKMIRRHGPVFLMTHFNHPREITAQAREALDLLVDHGIPVLNQMVLLNGVNNHPAIVQALSRRLLFLRVKPYYMFQCDPSEGTDHLRVSVEESLDIQRQLWGVLSGLAMPQLSLDIPDGGGKVSLVPEFEISKSKEKRTYKGWDGIVADYINPEESQKKIPADVSKYIVEWENTLHAKKGI